MVDHSVTHTITFSRLVYHLRQVSFTPCLIHAIHLFVFLSVVSASEHCVFPVRLYYLVPFAPFRSCRSRTFYPSLPAQVPTALSSLSGSSRAYQIPPSFADRAGIGHYRRLHLLATNTLLALEAVVFNQDSFLTVTSLDHNPPSKDEDCYRHGRFCGIRTRCWRLWKHPFWIN